MILAGLCLAALILLGLVWRAHIVTVVLSLMVLAIPALFVLLLLVKVIRTQDGPEIAALEIPPGPLVVAAEPATITLPEPVPPTAAAASGEEPADDPGDAAPAEPKPDWLGKPAHMVDGNYTVAVKSGPYVTVAECRPALEAAERQAVADYVESYLHEGAGHLVLADDAYIREHLQRQQYLQTVRASIGTMQQLHALLVFDDAARRDLQDRWRAALVEHRLWYLAGGGALVLSLIGSAFGYLVSSARPREQSVPR